MPHIHDQIDFVVTVYIVYNNKVLLIFHKEQQKWLPIGGHVELDEQPEEALYREIKEECGLDVEVVAQKPSTDFKEEGQKFLLTPTFLDIHRINENHEHIGMIYFARAKSDKVQLAEQEHEDIRWFGEEDLENPKFNLTEQMKFYTKEALKRVN